jgi:hypothetical protein
VVGDRVQLQQVILNLIDNAIEAMNAVNDDSRVLHLKTEPEAGEKVRITVQDFGPGIDAENTERIFDRFFSTKSQGMGMGLSICRSIVESHGGRLWVEAGFQRHGLVTPDAKIAPYEYTLNTVGIAERKAWATRVLDKLLPEMAGEKRGVMFAGQRYREFLVEPLRKRGIKVEVPMANLARGEQLAWLSDHQ